MLYELYFVFCFFFQLNLDFELMEERFASGSHRARIGCSQMIGRHGSSGLLFLEGSSLCNKWSCHEIAHEDIGAFSSKRSSVKFTSS